MELTSKQEHLATLLGMGHTKAGAYRQAYDVDPTRVDGALRVDAYKACTHPNVSLLANRIRQDAMAELVELEGYSRGEAFKDASKDRDLAHQERQAGAAVSATKLKAQLAGHLDDKTSADKALEGLASLMLSISRDDGPMVDGNMADDTRALAPALDGEQD